MGINPSSAMFYIKCGGLGLIRKKKGLKIVMRYFIRKIRSFAIPIPLWVSASNLYLYLKRG
jgi:hypothetical protein